MRFVLYTSILISLSQVAFASDQDLTNLDPKKPITQQGTLTQSYILGANRNCMDVYDQFQKEIDAWIEETGTAQKFIKSLYRSQLELVLQGYSSEYLHKVTQLLVKSGALAKCGTGNGIKYLLEFFKKLSTDRFELISDWMKDSGIIQKCDDGDHIYFLLDQIQRFPANKMPVVGRFLKNHKTWSQCLSYADALDFLKLFRDNLPELVELAMQYAEATGSIDDSTPAAKQSEILNQLLAAPPSNMQDTVHAYKNLQSKRVRLKEIDAEHPLSFDDLCELYDLQQDYQFKKKSGLTVTNHPFAELVKRIYCKAVITSTIVPAVLDIPQQEKVSCILFQPEKPNGALIVHTHGGPHVEMSTDTLHAEIAYYLSHGYTIICPNYRGSSDKDNKYEEHLPRVAAEDVYAAAVYGKTQMQGITSIFLRGGSYGSCVNAHLLRYIKLGRFQNIFSGVHLMGGLKYPSAHQMPDNIPIFIAHGGKDEICYTENAARFSLQLLYAGHKNVQTFISQYGDHHMMLPVRHGLSSPDEISNARQETRQYLEASTSFTQQVTTTGKATITDPEQQIGQLETVLKGLQSHTRRQLLQIMENFNEPLSLISLNPTPVVKFAGPTMAHLKMVLGPDFTGEPTGSLKNFLFKYFKPVAWPSRKKIIPGIGQQMLMNERFVHQVIQMIYAEEHHLASHPDTIVMYHAAPDHGMRLYIFMNIWLAMLRGEPADKIHTMRLFDQLVQSHPSIYSFLTAMRKQWKNADQSNELFNYMKGFPQRAIAAVPFLTAGRHNSAVCSLLWFYNTHLLSTPNKAPFKKVIANFFSILGIYSKARVSRFKELFLLDEVESMTIDTQQTMLQQIFVPADQINSSAYMCQMWGVEYEGAPEELTRPSHLVQLAEDPQAFENKLSRHSKVFTNPEGLELWNNRDRPADFKYSDFLQMRAIIYPDRQYTINTYIRNPDRATEFMSQILPDIRWAFGDFLMMGKSIPRCLMTGCQEFPDELRERLSCLKVRQWSDDVIARYQKSRVTPFLLDHSIFSGVQLLEPGEMKNAFKSLSDQQLTQIRGAAIAKACAKNVKLSHFDMVKYIRGCTNPNLDIWHHWGQGTEHGSHQTDDVRCASPYFQDRTYIDILAEAAKATLNDEEYARFMNYVYIFRKLHSGVHLCMHTGPYQELKLLGSRVSNYKLPESTPLTKEAKETRQSFKSLRDLTMDFAVTRITTEAYLAEKNGSKYITHKYMTKHQSPDETNHDDCCDSE